LVVRAEVTLAPAKAETYYPSGNGVSGPIHRQSRRPRASRALSRHTHDHPSRIDTVHRTTSRKRVRRVRWTSPIDPHPIAPDRIQGTPTARGSDRSFARAYLCGNVHLRRTPKTKYDAFSSSVSPRAPSRAPRARPPRVRTHARARTDAPRAIDRSPSSRARCLHARVVFTRARRRRRQKKYETPSAVSLAHHPRPRASSRTVKAMTTISCDAARASRRGCG
jgi:hypothetical protein